MAQYYQSSVMADIGRPSLVQKKVGSRFFKPDFFALIIQYSSSHQYSLTLLLPFMNTLNTFPYSLNAHLVLSAGI